MGTRIHGNTSYEPLTTFVRQTMRSRQDVLFNFGSFLPKFGCHGNFLRSLEILDSIFEIADPENHTIHAKFVLISCTEMKLCLFECLEYLYPTKKKPWFNRGSTMVDHGVPWFTMVGNMVNHGFQPWLNS